MPEIPTGERPVDGNHALLIGQLAGLAMREFEVALVDDEEGNHTDAFLVRRPSGWYRVTVKPEPVRST